MIARSWMKCGVLRNIATFRNISTSAARRTKDSEASNDAYYKLYESSYEDFKRKFDQGSLKKGQLERNQCDTKNMSASLSKGDSENIKSDETNVAGLTHVDSSGKASMVDVSSKATTIRTARAEARVLLDEKSSSLIKSNLIKKGDVFTVAQLAGIMASKRTSELIPLCHNLSLSDVNVNLCFEDEMSNTVVVDCEAKCVGQTGVEMEALVGASIAALTVYDMCKAVNKAIVITDLRLVSKSGGKSGHFSAK